MSSDVNYQPKFEANDEIFLEGQYATILDREDGEYHLALNGRFKWIDCSEIDSVAEPRERHYE